jgi:hypothetical protein
MNPPQEGRYTKIGAVAGVLALAVGYLAWQHPRPSASQPVDPPPRSQAPSMADPVLASSPSPSPSPAVEAAVQVPWVPAYPGSQKADPITLQTPQGRSGILSIETKDPIAEVLAFYEARFQEAGYQVRTRDFSANGDFGATLVATTADQKWTIALVASSTEAAGTTVSMIYSPTLGEPPSWVPAYPGGRDEGTLNSRSSEGKSGTSTVSTSDPAEKVIAFYRDRLTEAGFQVDATGDGKEHTLTAKTVDEKRTVGVIVSPGDPKGSKVVVNYGEKL